MQNRMKNSKINKMGGITTSIKMTARLLILFISLLMAFRAVAASDLDVLLEEARSRAANGDIDGAAHAYHKALQMDAKNDEARQGLSEAITAGHLQEPHAEEPDVLKAIDPTKDV